jgi:copper chaperone
MNNKRALFRIVGMYCASCKPIVEKQLNNEKGIKKIDINYVADSIAVDFDPSILVEQQIKNKLENSGYKFVRIAR